MRRMFLAFGTMFFHLQFFLEFLFVASGVIIDAFANFASHFGYIFSGHLNSY